MKPRARKSSKPSMISANSWFWIIRFHLSARKGAKAFALSAAKILMKAGAGARPFQAAPNKIPLVNWRSSGWGRRRTRMANPKRRHSNTRSRLRRAHDFLTPKSTGACPQCKAPKLPHRVCKSCGYYRGRQIVTIKVKEKAKKWSASPSMEWAGIMPRRS